MLKNAQIEAVSQLFVEFLPGLSFFNTTNLNLYHYAGNNPVRYVDPDGRTNINFSEKFRITMQNPQWAEEKLGQSSSELIGGKGCYLTGVTMALSNLGGKQMSLLDINSTKAFFNNGDMKGEIVAKQYGYKYDYWTRAVQGDLGTIINKLDKNFDNNAILAKIAWDKTAPNDANHWVGITGRCVVDPELGEGTYVKIIGTSNNDKPASRPSYWREKNGEYYIPTSKIERIHIFTKDNFLKTAWNYLFGGN